MRLSLYNQCVFGAFAFFICLLWGPPATQALSVAAPVLPDAVVAGDVITPLQFNVEELPPGEWKFTARINQNSHDYGSFLSAQSGRFNTSYQPLPQQNFWVYLKAGGAASGMAAVRFSLKIGDEQRTTVDFPVQIIPKSGPKITGHFWQNQSLTVPLDGAITMARNPEGNLSTTALIGQWPFNSEENGFATLYYFNQAKIAHLAAIKDDRMVNWFSRRALPWEPQFESFDQAPQALRQGAVLLSEFLPDPAPPQKDANDEWIELYNTTDDTIALDDLTIEDNTGVRKHLEGLILPRNFALLPKPLYRLSLNNDGDALTLRDSLGNVLDRTQNYGKAKEGFAYVRTNSDWQWSKTKTPGAPNVVTKDTAATAQNSDLNAANHPPIRGVVVLLEGTVGAKTIVIETAAGESFRVTFYRVAVPALQLGDEILITNPSVQALATYKRITVRSLALFAVVGHVELAALAKEIRSSAQLRDGIVGRFSLQIDKAHGKSSTALFDGVTLTIKLGGLTAGGQIDFLGVVIYTNKRWKIIPLQVFSWRRATKLKKERAKALERLAPAAEAAPALTRMTATNTAHAPPLAQQSATALIVAILLFSFGALWSLSPRVSDKQKK